MHHPVSAKRTYRSCRPCRASWGEKTCTSKSGLRTAKQAAREQARAEREPNGTKGSNDEKDYKFTHTTFFGNNRETKGDNDQNARRQTYFRLAGVDGAAKK